MKNREDMNLAQEIVMVGKVDKLLKQGKKPVEIANTLNCSIVSVMYWIQLCKEAEDGRTK